MADKFDQWGIVELMGHQRTAGRLSEEQVGGANMLRVDVPNGDGFRTAYYGASAIYALHVTEEKLARAAAAAMGSRPPFAYVLEQARLPGPSSPDDFDDDDGDQDP
ncbi:MAG: acetyltransferase [Thermoanaerobaculia bacterium]